MEIADYKIKTNINITAEFEINAFLAMKNKLWYRFSKRI